MTYRLEKIERLLLFELDYKVMDVSTQITVNISYIFNCTDPDIESHNRIFSHMPDYSSLVVLFL